MHVTRTYALLERDEINFADRVLSIGAQYAESVERILPDQRPPELTHLIDEEVDCFSHYNGQALHECVGHTQFVDYRDGISIGLRHFYPTNPDAEVSINDRGSVQGKTRLVPASLLSKDIKLDDIMVGRFVAGITKHDAHRSNDQFYLQIMAMSVCGNGKIRENLTFRGVQHENQSVFSALAPADFDFVSAIFTALEEAYGHNGLEFLGYEVLRNRYYMYKLLERDIGLSMAFDAYVKQYGSYMSSMLREYKDLVMQTANRLSQ